MGTLDIGYWDLFVGLLLLAIPVYFLWRFGTGLVRATVVGAVRMAVQLFFIGLYLRYLFYYDNPFINILWTLIMVAVATETALSRTRLKRSVLMMPVGVGFLATSLLVGLYFLGCVLRLDNVFSTRYFIPVIGILLGNMLSANVVALNTFYSGLQRERQFYYYLLGNGATRFEALVPFVRQALVKSFSPAIANMAVMGLVALPGTMIGQILGGSSPDVAVKYQMMIIVITVSASMLSLMIVLALASRRTFDEYDRPLPVLKEKKQ